MLVIGVLGAGLGTRLNPYTLTRPKPLVGLPDGSSILSNNLDVFNKIVPECNVDIIAGYKHDLFVSDPLISDFPNVNIVFNPFYRFCGPLGSIWTLINRENVLNTDSLVICNGDTLFFESAFSTINNYMSEPQHEDGYYLAISRETIDSDDSMKVANSQNNNVLAVSKKLADGVANAYSSGLFLIKGRDMVRDFRALLKEILIEDPDAIKDWSWHSVINVLISKGILVSSIELCPSSWIEVDSPKEYIDLVEKLT